MGKEESNSRTSHQCCCQKEKSPHVLIYSLSSGRQRGIGACRPSRDTRATCSGRSLSHPSPFAVPVEPATVQRDPLRPRTHTHTQHHAEDGLCSPGAGCLPSGFASSGSSGPQSGSFLAASPSWRRPKSSEGEKHTHTHKHTWDG